MSSVPFFALDRFRLTLENCWPLGYERRPLASLYHCSPKLRDNSTNGHLRARASARCLEFPSADPVNPEVIARPSSKFFRYFVESRRMRDRRKARGGCVVPQRALNVDVVTPIAAPTVRTPAVLVERIPSSILSIKIEEHDEW